MKERESGLILVVEDSEECAATLEIALAGLAGYEVRTVGTAEQAIAILEKHRAAAVITDLHLPGMDGLELVRRIRTGALRPDIPVIVLSGDSAADTPARAHRAGTSAFFSKPFSPAALRRRLEALLP